MSPKENSTPQIMGVLEMTAEDHIRAGGTLPEIFRGKEPNIPQGDLMTPEELQQYYDRQISGCQQALSLPEHQQRAPLEIAIVFMERDIPFLRRKGIDTRSIQKII